MSGRRITELAEASAVAPDDLFPIVDMSGTPTTKRATLQQLVDGVGPLPEPNVRGASYTLTLADQFGVVEMDAASANTVTVPPNSAVAYPVGTLIRVTQIGLGATTIAAGSGVTILSPFGLVLPAQYATVELRKRAVDDWVLDLVTGGATSKNSIETDDGDLQLVGDAAAPGNNKVYGTDGAGAKGWKDDPAGGGAADDGNVLGGSAVETSGVAVHPGASATTLGAVAIGDLSEAAGTPSGSDPRGSVAVGYGAKSLVIAGVAVGRLAEALDNNCVAVGERAKAPGGTSQATVAIGAQAGSSSSLVHSGVAIGQNASLGSRESVAVGLGSSAFRRSVAVGHNAEADNADSVALGEASVTTASFQVMVGPRDIEITGIVKGVVLVDRTLGTRHRVYLDNGVLEIEAA